MGIFPLSPYSRKSVSRKVFSYLSNHSNRMFGFFSSVKEDTSGRQQCSPHSPLLSQFTVLLKSYCLLLTLPAGSLKGQRGVRTSLDQKWSCSGQLGVQCSLGGCSTTSAGAVVMTGLVPSLPRSQQGQEQSF